MSFLSPFDITIFNILSFIKELIALFLFPDFTPYPPQLQLNQHPELKIIEQSSDVSRDFWEIPFSAGYFGAGSQKHIIVNFEK